MKENQPKYYVAYSYFSGDENTGEVIKSSFITEAESDKDALLQLIQHVVGEKKGEVLKIKSVQNVSGLFQLVANSIELECSMSEAEMCSFTDSQKHNIAFYVAEWLHGYKE